MKMQARLSRISPIRHFTEDGCILARTGLLCLYGRIIITSGHDRARTWRNSIRAVPQPHTDHRRHRDAPVRAVSCFSLFWISGIGSVDCRPQRRQRLRSNVDLLSDGRLDYQCQYRRNNKSCAGGCATIKRRPSAIPGITPLQIPIERLDENHLDQLYIRATS